MRLPALTFAALLAGCATSGVMDGVMSSWGGAHIDDVIRQWGYPHGETVVAGRRLVFWDRNVSVPLPATATTSTTANRIGGTTYVQGTTTYAGGGSLQGNCRRTLELDPQNVVIAWQWEGNNCPFATIGPYADWPRRR